MHWFVKYIFDSNLIASVDIFSICVWSDGYNAHDVLMVIIIVRFILKSYWSISYWLLDILQVYWSSTSSDNRVSIFEFSR